jgi:hypothetical protein
LEKFMLRLIIGLFVFASMVEASEPVPSQPVSIRQLFESIVRCRTLIDWQVLSPLYNGDITRLINYRVRGFEGGNTLAHCLVGRPDEVPSLDRLGFFQYIVDQGADLHVKNDAGETVLQLVQAPTKREFQDLIRQIRTVGQIGQDRRAGIVPGGAAPVPQAPVISAPQIDAQPQPPVPRPDNPQVKQEGSFLSTGLGKVAVASAIGLAIAVLYKMYNKNSQPGQTDQKKSPAGHSATA